MRANKTFICGLITLILGLALLTAGPITWRVIRAIRDSQIDNLVVVDQFSDDGYPDFATNSLGGVSPQTTRSFYVYNISNINEARAGAQPIFQEVGPFVYRNYYTLLDTTFENNGGIARYKSYERNIFQRNSSVMDDSTVLYVVNGAYVSILASAGSETNLGVALFSSFLNQTYDSLVNNFVRNQLLTSAVSATLPGYFLTSDSADSLREAWRNGVPVNAPGLNVSSSLPTSLASEINATTAVRLFTPTVMYSLASPTYYQLWGKALQDPATATFLQNYWGLSASAVSTLGAWLYQTWIPTYNPYVLTASYATAGATSLEDVALLQWTSLAATSTTPGVPGPSLFVLNSTAAPFFIEYAAWNQNINNGTGAAFGLPQARTVFSTFTNTTNWGTFLALLQSQNFGTITALYGLSQAQAVSLFQYSQYVVRSVTTPLFASGSGLYAAQTARNVLFGLKDPLLARVNPNGAFEATSNFTSEDDARFRAPVEAKYTNDRNRFRWFQTYDGLPNVPYWATPEPFMGGDGLNRAPHYIKKKDDWYVFETNLLRNVRLVYKNDVEIKGVDAWRYMLADDVFESSAVNPNNARYYTNFKGFHNMTSIPRRGVVGVPIFITKPHFLDCDQNLAQLVRYRRPDGVVQNGLSPDPNVHNTIVDVAYETGQTVNGQKTLQLNLQINPARFGAFTSGVNNTYYAPVFWVVEAAQLTDDQADEYRSRIGTANKAALGIIISFVVAGFLIAVLGAILIFLGHRKMSRGGVPTSSAKPAST